MKIGEELILKNGDLIKPMIGTLADITIAGETVRVRLIEVNTDFTSCKVVDKETKD